MDLHTEAACKKCKFFFAVFRPSPLAEKEQTLVGGQCRIRAPSVGFVALMELQEGSVATGGQPVPTQRIERCTASPHVSPDYWCGEFVKK